MQTLSSKIGLYVLLALSFFASSCRNDVVFSSLQKVSGKAWKKDAVFLFHFEIKEPSIPYNISMQLRNNYAYPYQNIWLIFEQQRFSDLSIKDTIEFRLVDDYGKWTGKGISLFQNQFPIREGYHFPDTGTYTISVRHVMQDTLLQGIADIGLLIERSHFLPVSDP